MSRVAVLLAREYSHRLIHGFYAQSAGYVATLVARELGCKSVVSVRGNDLDLGMFSTGRAHFLRWTLEHADEIAVVASSMADAVRAFSGRHTGIHFVPNGVDSEVFSPGRASPEITGTLGAAPRPWVGFSGELRFKKGLPVLLEVADRFTQRGEGTIFALGGVRREARPELERWLSGEPRRTKHFRAVPYLGDLDALADYYRAMDVCAFPSLWDGMPNALLEAMACARPVVAADVGGISDVLVDGACGVCVPAGSLDRFPLEVERVLQLPRRVRHEMGRAARARVRSRFSTHNERGALLDVYEQALQRSAAHA